MLVQLSGSCKVFGVVSVDCTSWLHGLAGADDVYHTAFTARVWHDSESERGATNLPMGGLRKLGFMSAAPTCADSAAGKAPSTHIQRCRPALHIAVCK